MLVELATIGSALVGIYWMARIRSRKQSEAREALYDAEAAQAVEMFIAGRFVTGWEFRALSDGSYAAELIRSIRE